MEDRYEEVVKDLQKLQGRYVKVHYQERSGTFFWLGDTKYFVTKVEEEPSPHLRGILPESDTKN